MGKTIRYDEKSALQFKKNVRAPKRKKNLLGKKH
jgi:hypothetical protein